MPTLSELGITHEDRALLLRALNDGAVNLLTGAGTSYGAMGGDGMELKGATDLARELNAKFSLPNVEPDCANLQLVYGDIASIAASRPMLATFLLRRFTKCQISWQSLLFKFPWKTIWTLNIDDLLQRAIPGGFSRTPRTYSWNDSLHVRALDRHELQIVHLHGQAASINQEPNGIIFSLQEYASRPEISPGWHSEFRSEFVKKPFIICGSRLRDEFDLATVLAFGNHSRERGGCPSLIVLREFSPGEKDRFKRQGLIPIESTGEDFFSSLFREFEAWANAHHQRFGTSHDAESEIHTKFRKLELSQSHSGKLIDFYSAAEAQWQHIIADLDARLPALGTHLGWLSDKSGDVRISLITGGPVAGKTSYALRLAHELAVAGYEVFDFRGEEQFSKSLVLDYLVASSPAVLIFDDCADFSGSISSLLTEAAKRGTRLRAIATADKKRHRGVLRDLSLSQLRTIELEPLRKDAFFLIFDKRRQKGRLGRCTGQDVESCWTDFKEHFNMRFLEWLESLEAALPFQQAIERILDDGTHQNAHSRRLVLASAATHRFGFSLPFDAADTIRGTQGLEELVQREGNLADIAYLDEKGLRLRSRSFSMNIWRRTSMQEKYDISLFLAQYLAPLLVPQAIARRTYPFRILRELMNWQVVRDDLSENANKWYEALLPQLGWNSRYWDQRALLELRNGHQDTAYSYAKVAVSKQPSNAFPHNTLGKVCLTIATHRRDQAGYDRFWEGVRSLEDSRRLAVEGGTEWEHPYVTFFAYSLRAYQLYPESAERISDEWARWMRVAKESRLFDFDEEGQAKLKDYQTKWLKLAVAR